MLFVETIIACTVVMFTLNANSAPKMPFAHTPRMPSLLAQAELIESL